VPAAGGADGICELRGGGELMIASMLARSGSRDSGETSAWVDASGLTGALGAGSLSLSKTWVASSSSSQSMSSFVPPFFILAV
jgi:hypothetical protein